MFEIIRARPQSCRFVLPRSKRSPISPLNELHAAVDVEARAGDATGVVRGEEDDGGADFLSRAGAPQGNAVLGKPDWLSDGSLSVR